MLFIYFLRASCGGGGALRCPAGEWRLLDGDKIAALLAAFVGTELKAAGLAAADMPTMAVVSESTRV